MPVYNAPEKFLREAIESVMGQVYPDWELCIADDASPLPHVREVLQEYADRDPRIKIGLSRIERAHCRRHQFRISSRYGRVRRAARS